MAKETTKSLYDKHNALPAVRRERPSKALLKTSLLHFTQKMSADAKHELQSIERRAQHLVNVATPLRRLIEQDSTAVSSMKALHLLAKREQEGRVQVFQERAALKLPRTLSFTVNGDFQVIGPPYDAEWQNQTAFAHRDTGAMFAGSQIRESAAGIGVFLSSPVRSLVRIAPFAPLTYEWSVLTYGVPYAIKGSVGVVVYVNGMPSPAFDYRAVLWDVHLNALYETTTAHDSGSSTIGEALSRAVLVTMEPDSSYLVWVWCSVLVHRSDVEAHLTMGGGQIKCDVPFMIIDAGPASVLG